jgi:hypothetical protein
VDSIVPLSFVGFGDTLGKLPDELTICDIAPSIRTALRIPLDA